MSKTESLVPTVEKAVLVYVNEDDAEDTVVEEELKGLCEAAGVEPVGEIRQRLERPYKSTYVGTGKVTEVAALVRDTGADVVIVDGELSGIQGRNLEDRLKTKVVDRTRLILDIFARRARTKEGMLQVELAQLSYMMPRLMSVYTKFERQKGGIGMRGPGETKLETDRRLVRDKIDRLEEEIGDVSKHRTQQRAARRKHPFPFASIVGYTSAGKSTLMNRLAETDLLADAMPFATLDPTTRKIDLPDGYALFLTDTVGFIRNLPTNLVAAFRSTLEEATHSDFVLHVVDLSAPSWEMQVDAVRQTLEALNAGDKPQVTVFNKVDRIEDRSLVTRAVAEFPNAVAISSLTGEGMDDLHAAILRQVRELLAPMTFVLPYDRQELLQDCYDFGKVRSIAYEEAGVRVEAELVAEMREKVRAFVV